MEKEKSSFGNISWADLTTPISDQLKEFYQNVLGWRSEGIPMKDGEDAYEDYIMKSPDGKAIAGICHAKGINKEVPPQWIIYISVENVEETAQKAVQEGGEIIKEYHRKDGSLHLVMIQDPAGAVFGIARPE